MPDSVVLDPAEAGGTLDRPPHAEPSLFPAAPRRREIEDWLTQSLQDAAADVAAGPVSGALPFSHYAAMLEDFSFDATRPAETVMAWMIDHLTHGVVHINHPRYFGLFNPAPAHPAQCADRIVSLFNPQLATATTSPFPVALEARVLRAFAEKAGLPASSAGHFTSGGSEANATAFICALTAADAQFAVDGARAFAGQPRLYVSKDAHLAWLKIAHLTGAGRSAVCLVPTDGTGRMDAGALEAAIENDVAAGRIPVMIASTAGTTSAGMVDPLRRCGDIARRFGIWHHVDAAWGGALLCSQRHRAQLAGIETADSVTIDAHKWLAATMGCGMILVARPGALQQAFHAVMDCMPSNAAAIDPYVTTMQWSRRFIGLRLFACLAQAGWAGYGAHVDKSIELAAILENALRQDGWTTRNHSGMAVLCMQPPGGVPARAIAKAVTEGREAWISAVEFEGEDTVRICITSGETTIDDLNLLRAQLTLAIRGNGFVFPA